MLGKTKVKYIQSLSHKKFRDEYQSFIIEGPKIVEEFLLNRVSLIKEIYAIGDWLQSAAPLLTKVYPDKVNEVELEALERISGLTAPNQVLAIVQKIPETELQTEINGWTLLLDNIQDPGNMGTIIRTADWFGVKQICCSPSCVDIYNPKVVQSTMGSLLRVSIHYIDLADLIKSNSSIPRFAATLHGENLFTMQIPAKGFIIIGNESRGVSEELLLPDTRRVTIPGAGNAESLNAAVAAGIILASFWKAH